MAAVTVSDLLDGHVSLDVECLDRIYLDGSRSGWKPVAGGDPVGPAEPLGDGVAV